MSKLDSAVPREPWPEVRELLARLYRIVDRLEELFPGRKFTPDGHLVGSVGEVIAADMFALDLLPGSSPAHDAVAEDGRKVQIKLTQGTKGVPLSAEPDYLVVLRLAPERFIEVVYNGPGGAPWSRSGKKQKNGQRPISLAALRRLDAAVSEHERLPRSRASEGPFPVRL